MLLLGNDGLHRGIDGGDAADNAVINEPVLDDAAG